jgi:uncharacterized protein (TIGR03437 family)
MRAPRFFGLRFAGLLLTAVISAPCAGAQQYVISTVAGGAPPPPTTAASASIGDPTRLAADTAGNVYFSSLHSVFKVSPTGALTRVAGNGRPGNTGDGGPATAAQLNFPMGLALDGAGNIYIADRDANVVRKVTPGGTIQTVAGTSTAGYSGDSGPAMAAQLNGPYGVAIDAAGNLYIADTKNEAIRKVTSDGTINTAAGTGVRGYVGDGGPARSARLDGPEAVAVDSAGNFYIADTFNGRIRRVGTNGTIATVAGVGSTGLFGGDGGPATAASISLPTDIAIDPGGRLYIADFGNSRIRVVSNGVISTVVGLPGGVALVNGELAVNARLEGPTGVTVDPGGNVYFVEAGLGSGTGLALGDYKIWTATAAGIVATLVGNGVPSFSGDGSPATAAQLNTPIGVAANPAGGILIGDSLNQRVRATTASGTITTISGNGTGGFNGELVAVKSALLRNPHGIASDAQGNWYLADTDNNRIREAQQGGNLFTIAGNGNASYFGDNGPALKGSVNHPEGVAVDGSGNVYIADTLDNAVRKVSQDGSIVTIAGNGNAGYTGDNGPATQAHLTQPRGVAVDANGVVYIADTGNGQIRRVDTAGMITTVNTGSSLKDPRGIAVDKSGNLYIADTGSNLVKRVAADGSLTTIAGNGTCCYSGDGGLALNAQLNAPWGIAVDAAGNIFVADSGNNAVRQLAPLSAAVSVAAVTNGASNLAGAIAPGEVVALYGSGLGSVQQVLFNGTPGPLLYATAGQVAAVTPYAVTGGSVQVTVQGGGASAAPVTVGLAATAPGIFTIDGSGRGQAAALNQDNSVNSASAAAAPGSVLSLFVTGEGQTAPPGVDGKPAAMPLPQPVAPVSVTIGGVPAQVQYAGGAPGIVAGVMQVNVTVPLGALGVVPVVVTVGGVASQPGVTVVVR